MTPDLMRALAISGGILVGVVILIVIVSMVTVMEQRTCRGVADVNLRATAVSIPAIFERAKAV